MSDKTVKEILDQQNEVAFEFSKEDIQQLWTLVSDEMVRARSRVKGSEDFWAGLMSKMNHALDCKKVVVLK